MGWVGFVKRPCANVSADSKYPNSSCIAGMGTGMSPNRDKRNRITAIATPAIARPLLLASRTTNLSIERNAGSPRRGTNHASTRHKHNSKLFAWTKRISRTENRVRVGIWRNKQFAEVQKSHGGNGSVNPVSLC